MVTVKKSKIVIILIIFIVAILGFYYRNHALIRAYSELTMYYEKKGEYEDSIKYLEKTAFYCERFANRYPANGNYRFESSLMKISLAEKYVKYLKDYNSAIDIIMDLKKNNYCDSSIIVCDISLSMIYYDMGEIDTAYSTIMNSEFFPDFDDKQKADMFFCIQEGRYSLDTPSSKLNSVERVEKCRIETGWATGTVPLSETHNEKLH